MKQRESLVSLINILKEPGDFCKLYIEESFDHVNWGFLITRLKKVGLEQILHKHSRIPLRVLVVQTSHYSWV